MHGGAALAITGMRDAQGHQTHVRLTEQLCDLCVTAVLKECSGRYPLRGFGGFDHSPVGGALEFWTACAVHAAAPAFNGNFCPPGSAAPWAWPVGPDPGRKPGA